LRPGVIGHSGRKEGSCWGVSVELFHQRRLFQKGLTGSAQAQISLPQMRQSVSIGDEEQIERRIAQLSRERLAAAGGGAFFASVYGVSVNGSHSCHHTKRIR